MNWYFDKIKNLGSVNCIGITNYIFVTKKFSYKISIMEGIYVKPFLMLSVFDMNEKIREDMITEPFINAKNIIKLFQGLKNELK